MAFRTFNRSTIYYEDHGHGDDSIILMHHGFGSSKIWSDIYPRLVDQGFRVVFFDRRGFGQSEEGDGFQELYEDGRRYRTDSVLELNELKAFLKIGPCHLVGQCEGGVIGVDYAGTYPNEVRSLTLASTQCFSKTTMKEAGDTALAATFALLDPKLQLKMIDWHGERAQVRYERILGAGGAYGVGYFDLRPALPAVHCPTLVLYPDRSAIFEVEQGVELYRHLPKGELAVLPHCGHNTYEYRPDDYIRILLDFIARSSGKGGRKEASPFSCLA
jgi:pimeloyl-ACP methyl ester carboxylesterase